MKHCILFRKCLDDENEYEYCSRFLNTFEFRSEIPSDSVVIGRYSVLPYYKELEDELRKKNSRLINSYEQHIFIADVLNWSNDILGGLTPNSYLSWNNLPKGQYVVKGRTNSRKHQWNTHMFAPNRETVPVIARNLLQDTLISDQGIVVREYHELKKISEGINGLPITNEWRVFVLYGKIMAYGYYWASDLDAAESPEAKMNQDAFNLLYKVIERIGDLANFYVIDIAQKVDGSWIVIELNDGQMSGLSMIEPEKFYIGLFNDLKCREYLEDSNGNT